MSVSACLVVRDEERFLPECLRRLAPYVDEIVVVDTGSTDRTVAVAQAAGARVFAFPWRDDFSAARNFALAQAQGDHVLVVDADEWLLPEGAEALRALPPDGPQGYYVTIVNYADVRAEVEIDRFQGIRLVRRDPRIRFEGRVHEQIVPSLLRLRARLGVTGVTFQHFGYAPEVMEQKKKRGRNLRLFALEAELTLADRLHLAREHMALGGFETAERLLFGLLADPEVNPASPLGLFSRLSLCECLAKAEKFPELHAVADEALALFPDQGEFAFFRALASAQKGDVTGAVRDLLWALSEPPGVRKLWSLGSTRGDAWALLARLLEEAGRSAEAHEARVEAVRHGNLRAVSMFVDATVDRVGVEGVLAALRQIGLTRAQQEELSRCLLRHLLLAAAERLGEVPEPYRFATLVATGRLAEARRRLPEEAAPGTLDALGRAIVLALCDDGPPVDPLARYLRDEDAPRPDLSPPAARSLALLLAQGGYHELLLTFLRRELGGPQGEAVAASLLRKTALLPTAEVQAT